MKTITKIKMICIHGDNAEDYQAQFNKKLEGIEKPTIEIDRTVPFLCYVLYKEIESVPENKLEEYEQEADRAYQCVECPYFEKGTDKRKKLWYCNYHEKPCFTHSRCCEVFYEKKEADNELF